MADVYSMTNARDLLHNKFVIMFGDSNMRSMYKDLLYLLAEGTIAPAQVFRSKKKGSFCGDRMVDACPKDTAGRNYFETREYQNDHLYLRYHFITQVYNDLVQKELKAIQDGTIPIPDVVIINSCIWDITRWGAKKEDKYKRDIVDLLSELHRLLPPPRTLTIWTSTMPVATERVKGGVFIKQLEFMKHSMRFMILEANKFIQQVCKCFDVDMLDLHYHMRFQLHRRTNDGLHWESPAIRHLTNLILTHIAVSWNVQRPGWINAENLREVEATAKEVSAENNNEVMLDSEIMSYIRSKIKEGEQEPGVRKKMIVDREKLHKKQKIKGASSERVTNDLSRENSEAAKLAAATFSDRHMDSRVLGDERRGGRKDAKWTKEGSGGGRELKPRNRKPSGSRCEREERPTGGGSGGGDRIMKLLDDNQNLAFDHGFKKNMAEHYQMRFNDAVNNAIDVIQNRISQLPRPFPQNHQPIMKSQMNFVQDPQNFAEDSIMESQITFVQEPQHFPQSPQNVLQERQPFIENPHSHQHYRHYDSQPFMPQRPLLPKPVPPRMPQTYNQPYSYGKPVPFWNNYQTNMGAFPWNNRR